MTKILLIGPLPPPMGGDTRHFRTLLEDLQLDARFTVRCLNSSRGPKFSSQFANTMVGLRILWKLVFSLRRFDMVSYHASDRGMFIFGPIVVILGRLYGRRVVLRAFGGSFGDFYECSGSLAKWWMSRTVLATDVLFLQTRRSIEQLLPFSSASLEWLSTYIRQPTTECRRKKLVNDQSRCCRFVFLGHLWKTKGIEEILDASMSIDDEVSIHIFGPPDEYGQSEIASRGSGKVIYGGLLSHEEVDKRLWEFDCLILPTYHSGEGYPGVIAEAYAHELPVITTDWLAIPEIVDDASGILIPVRDANALAIAINKMHKDPVLWHRLRNGAKRKATDFDHTLWSEKFADVCIREVSV